MARHALVLELPTPELLEHLLALRKRLAPHRGEQREAERVRRHGRNADQGEAREHGPYVLVRGRELDRVRVGVARERGQE